MQYQRRQVMVHPKMLAVILCVGLSCGKPLAAQQATMPNEDIHNGTTTAARVVRRTLPQEGESVRLDYLRKILQQDPSLRQKLEKEAKANGQSELLKWFQNRLPFLSKKKMERLANSQPLSKVDPLKYPNDLLENEDWNAACEAYLVALRRDPDLFDFSTSYKPTRAFIKAGRLLELVEFFDAARLQKMSDHNHGMEGLFFAAIRNDSTRAAGYELLDRVFLLKSYSANLFLQKYGDRDFWKDVPNPLIQLRFIFLKTDFSQAGWTGFFASLYYSDATEQARSRFTLARPLYHNRGALQQFALEIRQLLRKHKTWESGWAILAVIEAESGDCQEATAILKQRFLQPDSIPPLAAWSLGESLAGKDKKLDHAVIELLETCIRQLDGKTYNLLLQDVGPRNGNPDISLRFSPIRTLAKLYAADGREAEARRLLYGLIDATNQHPLIRGYVINENERSRPYTADSACKTNQCNTCHRNERSFYDVLSMSDAMTDIGYPIDSFLALGSIDHSFNHLFTSPQGWVESDSAEGQWLNKMAWGEYSTLRRDFNKQLAKSRMTITPKLVAEAIEQGVFQRSLRRETSRHYAVLDLIRQTDEEDETTTALRALARNSNPITSNSHTGDVDLMLSVRGSGEANTPALYSPLIEILQLAVDSNERQPNKYIQEIDRALLGLSESNSGRLEAEIASTVFAFLRQDLDSAKKRLKRLHAITKYPESDGVALWLAARYALKHDQTRVLGAVLAERALIAAESQPDSRLKKAILRERAGIRTK